MFESLSRVSKRFEALSRTSRSRALTEEKLTNKEDRAVVAKISATITRFRLYSSGSDSAHSASSSTSDFVDASAEPDALVAAMDIDSRISTIESVQQTTQTQLDDHKLLLETILKQIASLHVPAPPLATLAPTPTLPLPSASAVTTPSTKSRLKPGTPSDFDGERTKGRAFLNSCELYFAMCASEFCDDQAKVFWMLSYMKSGRAAVFADRTLRYQSKNQSVRYPTYELFRKTFVTMFCPENEATSAIMRLESARYFQGSRNVDSYIDEFESLIDVSGYMDAIAIVVKFRRGLNAVIQDRIAESGHDRPDDDDIEAWYSTARRFNQNRLANEAFHSTSQRCTAPASSATSSAPRPVSSRNPFHSFASTSPAAKPTPSLSPGIPMDIDASRAGQTPEVCYRCKKPGHRKRDCPHRFDIRYMTSIADFEDEMNEIALERDQAAIQDASDEKSVVSSVEDFSRSNE